MGYHPPIPWYQVLKQKWTDWEIVGLEYIALQPNLVGKIMCKLVLHVSRAGAAAGPLDVIRVVPHLALPHLLLPSNMLMVAGWGSLIISPPALSCLHSNFKGWMVWIEPGAGSESKTKPIVAGLGLFTISGSPPSFWRIRQTFNSAGACDYEVQQIEDATSFLRF